MKHFFTHSIRTTLVLIMFVSTIPFVFADDENYHPLVDLRFQDQNGAPIITPLTLRVSLWDVFDVRNGDILQDGAIDSNAMRYGGYQSTVDVTPVDRFYLDGRYGVYQLNTAELAGFPTHLDENNAFLQLEYKAVGASDVDYQVYDFIEDSGVPDISRLHLYNALLQTIPPDAGPQTVSDVFTIDENNDSLAGVTLKFGSLLQEFLQWDVVNDYFYLSDALVVDGNINQNGSVLRLNWNAVGDFDQDVEIRAGQGDEATGVIRYDDGNNRWEFSNDSTTFFPFVDIPGFSSVQLSGSDGQLSGPMVVLKDPTRANKLLTTQSIPYTWASNSLSKDDWLKISDFNFNVLGFVMPYDGTIVEVAAHSEGVDVASKDIFLYINETQQQDAVVTFQSLWGDFYTNTGLNIDFNAGDRLRLISDAQSLAVDDVVVTLYVRWRVSQP